MNKKMADESLGVTEFLASPEGANNSPKWGFADGETPLDGVLAGGRHGTDPPQMPEPRQIGALE